MSAHKVLIVDDQRLFSECLAGILRTIGTSVLGEIRWTGSGEEALVLYQGFRPDLVLLDIFMPGMGGLEALRQLRALDAEAKIIMLTTFGYDTYVREALAGGASGYLLKDSAPGDVLASMEAVWGGQTVLSPAAVSSLSGALRQPQRGGACPEWFPLLSEKEKKILLLISKGLSNEEIADRLNLGKHTIRNYVSAVYDKMGVKDRFAAIQAAIESQIPNLVLE